jgi:hypothetical protein
MKSQATRWLHSRLTEVRDVFVFSVSNVWITSSTNLLLLLELLRSRYPTSGFCNECLDETHSTSTHSLCKTSLSSINYSKSFQTIYSCTRVALRIYCVRTLSRLQIQSFFPPYPQGGKLRKVSQKSFSETQ